MITGSAGTSTKDLADILNDEHGIWNLGLSLTTPIFNQGKLRSNVKLKKTIKENLIQELVSDILQAFSEIEHLLNLDKSYTNQLEALGLAQSNALETYNLARQRYEKGLTTLELVLNSQKQYNDIRSRYLLCKREKLNNHLSLMLVLGGDMDFSELNNKTIKIENK